MVKSTIHLVAQDTTTGIVGKVRIPSAHYTQEPSLLSMLLHKLDLLQSELSVQHVHFPVVTGHSRTTFCGRSLERCRKAATAYFQGVNPHNKTLKRLQRIILVSPSWYVSLKSICATIDLLIVSLILIAGMDTDTIITAQPNKAH